MQEKVNFSDYGKLTLNELKKLSQNDACACFETAGRYESGEKNGTPNYAVAFEYYKKAVVLDLAKEKASARGQGKKKTSAHGPTKGKAIARRSGKKKTVAPVPGKEESVALSLGEKRNEAIRKIAWFQATGKEGVKRDDDAALKFLESVGQLKLAMDIAVDLMSDPVYKSDRAKSFRWLLVAAKVGEIRAIRMVAKRLERGDGVGRNDKAAFSWYQYGADKLNDPECAQIVAERYRRRV